MELKLEWHRTKIGIQTEFSKSWKKQAMNEIEYCPYWMQVEYCNESTEIRICKYPSNEMSGYCIKYAIRKTHLTLEHPFCYFMVHFMMHHILLYGNICLSSCLQHMYFYVRLFIALPLGIYYSLFSFLSAFNQFVTLYRWAICIL